MKNYESSPENKMGVSIGNEELKEQIVNMINHKYEELQISA